VTPEIAEIRGIPFGQDSLSPNRHPEVANMDQLLDMIMMIRDITGKPVGIKTAVGGWKFINALCEAVVRRGLDSAPDFFAVDGGEGGSGRRRRRWLTICRFQSTRVCPGWSTDCSKPASRNASGSLPPASW